MLYAVLAAFNFAHCTFALKHLQYSLLLKKNTETGTFDGQANLQVRDAARDAKMQHWQGHAVTACRTEHFKSQHCTLSPIMTRFSCCHRLQPGQYSYYFVVDQAVTLNPNEPVEMGPAQEEMHKVCRGGRGRVSGKGACAVRMSLVGMRDGLLPDLGRGDGMRRL